MPRSAREIDIDPRTKVGLSFPLQSDANDNFAMTKNSFEQAEHNLRNLLLTSLRERPLNPMFGSRLRELCFEPIDDELEGKIEGEVIKSVSLWLPYINIGNVQLFTNEADNNKIIVRISYSTTLDPDMSNTMDIQPTG